MATAQKASFLTNDVVHRAVLNPQGSKAFVKKMIPAAVSFIIHQRTNLSRSDFETRKRNGVMYKVLKPKVREPFLKDVCNWLVGILDAFERNYLRELFLVISTKEVQPRVLESYKFQFKYMGTDVIPLHSPATKEEISEATDSLLKGIASLDEYKQFKKGEFTLDINVGYYEDVTPRAYEPPFIENSVIIDKLLEDIAGHANNSLYLGRINTGFHIVKCRTQGDVFSMNKTISTNIDLDEEMELEESKAEKCTFDVIEEKLEMETEDFPITIIERSEPGLNESLHSISSATSSDIECVSINTTIDSNSNGDCIIKCMCQISAEFNYVDVVRCTNCSFLQHVTCVVEPIEDNAYICQVCKFDDYLTPNEAKQRELVSAYRLAVAITYLTKKSPIDILEKLPKANKGMLLNKFEQIGAVFIRDDKLHFHLDILEDMYDKMKWY